MVIIFLEFLEFLESAVELSHTQRFSWVTGRRCL